MAQNRFLFAALLMVTVHATAQTYVWDAQKSALAKGTTKATLLNKVIVEESKGENVFDQSITTKTSGSAQKVIVVKNDLAQIEAAYPNAKQAMAVLVSDDCSGSSCGSKNLTLIVAKDSGVNHYRVGSPQRITLTMTGNQVVSGQADGISGGVDQYGSQAVTSRRFIPGAGFVVAGFKSSYAKLIGEHPEKLFDEQELREPLAKAAGLETFRDLRKATGVASPATLIQGRYVVLQGCVPHDCGGNYGFVMIDAVTSDFFWARFSEGKHRYSGATRKIDRAVMEQIFSDEDFSQNDDAPLSVSPTGKIIYKSVKR